MQPDCIRVANMAFVISHKAPEMANYRARK